MNMLLIPAGAFWRGSRDDDLLAESDEKPQGRIEVAPFHLSSCCITIAEYAEIMDDRKSTESSQDPDCPATDISWKEAVEFCNALSVREGLRPFYRIKSFGTEKDLSLTIDADCLDTTGYRLPTETEWEYACRGGSQDRWYFGNDPGRLGENAWYLRNAGMKTHPVGLKKPNQFGLHDMLGNVWEWCRDWYRHDSYQSDPPVTGPKYGTERVLRGGSFLNPASTVRCATRWRAGRGSTEATGFRIARNMKTE